MSTLVEIAGGVADAADGEELLLGGFENGGCVTEKLQELAHADALLLEAAQHEPEALGPRRVPERSRPATTRVRHERTVAVDAETQSVKFKQELARTNHLRILGDLSRQGQHGRQ